MSMKEYMYENLFNTAGSLTLQEVLINFAAACIIGALIFLSYRLCHNGTVYSKKFNVSLLMLTLITTLVMNTIGNNIALSLGMVGALSIVRFRTAIKDSRDTAYIFWAIAVGICCGVSDYLIAGIGTFIIFLALVLFGVVKDNQRIMIIVKMDGQALQDVEKGFVMFFKEKAVLRVQNFSGQSKKADVIYEVSDELLKTAEKESGLLTEYLTNISGVESISIVRQEDDVNQ